MVAILNNIFAIAVALLSAVYLLEGIPHFAPPSHYPEILGVFRIAYFSMYAFALYRLRDAAAFLYGAEKKNEFLLLRYFRIFVAGGLILGVLTPVFAALHFALTVAAYRPGKSRYFGIEEIYGQLTALFFVFANSGLRYSVDELAGIPSIWGNENWISPFNFLVLAISIALFSGGIEKLKSSIWRKGLGFYYFTSLPHITRRYWSGKFNYWTVAAAGTYLTVLNQILILPFLAVPYLRTAMYFGELFFSTTLIIIVAFSFIAETFILLFSFFIAVDVAWMQTTNIAPRTDPSWLVFLLATLLFLGTLSALAPAAVKTVRPIYWLIRYTTALAPFLVFTEVHVFGLLVYQIRGGGSDKDDHQVVTLMEIFDDDGRYGRYQRWFPRFYLTTTYRVSDVCYRHQIGAGEPEDEACIRDLFVAALSTQEALKEGVRCAEMRVKAFRSAKKFEKNTEHWMNEEWTVIAKYDAVKDELSLWINDPPKLLDRHNPYEKGGDVSCLSTKDD